MSQLQSISFNLLSYLYYHTFTSNLAGNYALVNLQTVNCYLMILGYTKYL